MSERQVKKRNLSHDRHLSVSDGSPSLRLLPRKTNKLAASMETLPTVMTRGQTTDEVADSRYNVYGSEYQIDVEKLDQTPLFVKPARRKNMNHSVSLTKSILPNTRNMVATSTTNPLDPIPKFRKFPKLDSHRSLT